LAWSPDGSRLASASEDTSARIWDVARGKEVAALFGHAAAVYAVAWSPDGRRVATGSYDLSVKIWDPVTGGEVCSFDKPGGIEQMIYALAWSRDGQRLACSDMEGNICILDSAPGFPGKTAAVPPQLPARESRSDTAMIRSLKSYCTAVEPMAANDPDALRRLAWIFAAARYPEVRDGRKALVYAQQASTLTGGKNPVVLSILAAAYAEAGDYTNAVSTQKQALAVLPNVDLRTEYAAALKQFESHQPVRSDSW
jgi:WD40 repeat protein